MNIILPMDPARDALRSRVCLCVCVCGWWCTTTRVMMCIILPFPAQNACVPAICWPQMVRYIFSR